jgi:toxin ParE1/3/4
VKPLRFTLAAEKDLVEIETYLFDQSETAAERVLDDIEATCRLLETHPGAGRHREELGLGVLSFPVGSYVIFYTESTSAVVILRILHGHRDIPTVF